MPRKTGLGRGLESLFVDNSLDIAIDNRDIMKNMGSIARTDVYKKYFSMEKFAENTLKTIGAVIDD